MWWNHLIAQLALCMCITCFTPHNNQKFNLRLVLYAERHVQRHAQHVREALNSLTDAGRGSGVLVVDGDNVRGKSRFRLSPKDLLSHMLDVTNTAGLQRSVLHFDHGFSHHSYTVENGTSSAALCATFSGPVWSADDVIVRDVVWWSQYLLAEMSVHKNTELSQSGEPLGELLDACGEAQGFGRSGQLVVVTDDSELRTRCRRSAKGIVFISSLSFVMFLGLQAREPVEANSDEGSGGGRGCSGGDVDSGNDVHTEDLFEKNADSPARGSDNTLEALKEVGRVDQDERIVNTLVDLAAEEHVVRSADAQSLASDRSLETSIGMVFAVAVRKEQELRAEIRGMRQVDGALLF